MNYTRSWINAQGVQVDTITATGLYTLNDLPLGGKEQGTLALRLEGAGSASVKLQTVDATQIGDTMAISTTTPKILTASATPVEITLAGPRILNVTALTGSLVAEVWA